MLKISHISKTFNPGTVNEKRAIEDLSLELKKGDFATIIGSNGAGKSTLFNAIAGSFYVDDGFIELDGEDVNDRSIDPVVLRARVGMVFQKPNPFPMSIYDNIAYGPRTHGVRSKAQLDEIVEKSLRGAAIWDEVKDRLNKSALGMSGGQQQRLCIARALAVEPEVLLMDESTSALDPISTSKIEDLALELKEHYTVVMVTHNPELAEQYATRIVNLRDGVIRSDSDPFVVDETAEQPAVHKTMGRASMSFATSLALSFNNLKTKKARTLLTSFAGSIGIIGIALILALSSGVNEYIQNMEEETLSEYPLQIQSTGFELY